MIYDIVLYLYDPMYYDLYCNLNRHIQWYQEVTIRTLDSDISVII